MSLATRWTENSGRHIRSPRSDPYRCLSMVWQEGGSRPLVGPSPLGARLPSNASVVSSQVRSQAPNDPASAVRSSDAHCAASARLVAEQCQPRARPCAWGPVDVLPIALVSPKPCIWQSQQQRSLTACHFANAQGQGGTGGTNRSRNSQISGASRPSTHIERSSVSVGAGDRLLPGICCRVESQIALWECTLCVLHEATAAA